MYKNKIKYNRKITGIKQPQNKNNKNCNITHEYISTSI